ncbi:MAG: hypothetical protein C4558_00745 [Dehalococcoidia bacterium]|nr:MAG: hypothetical protein C4558_00745 [Dehalococcoidia bacterium]
MRATVQAVMPFELHGTRYYQVIYLPDDADNAQQARLSHDMVDTGLQPGETVEVHAILGVVDGIRRVAKDA